MKYLSETLKNNAFYGEFVVYALICENGKFYVGQTSNLKTRLLDAHFGKRRNRMYYLQKNPPIDLFFIVRTGIKSYDIPNGFKILAIEDYVTVVLSKKYGTENVYGGFCKIRTHKEREQFVNKYNYADNHFTVHLVNSLVDYELPELSEIIEYVNNNTFLVPHVR